MCGWSWDGCECGMVVNEAIKRRAKFLRTTQRNFNRGEKRGLTLRDKRQYERWVQINNLKKIVGEV
ncbi:MAG: hypothetical protein M1383_05685 [Patescibacteria group bacterium]|nr:hypothetical protein [Patescibacteria group bacterium]